MMGDKTESNKHDEIRKACEKFARGMATGRAHANVQPTGEDSNDGGGYQV